MSGTHIEKVDPVRVKFAIIMPVYNEGLTIENTISEIEEKMMKKLPNSLVKIYEDGSKDNTKQVVRSLAKKYSWIELHTSHTRKGYSRAVRDALTSIDDSEFEYLLFLDSDGQYDPHDFFALWDIMKAESLDIVMARRRNRTEPMYRIILSSGLRTLEHVLFDVQCKDITSAFRLMKTRVAKNLASKIKFSSYSFWLEFTARAAVEGYRIKEVSVTYRSRKDGGKSNVYGLKKMPKIVSNELGTLERIWWEYKRNEIKKFASVGVSGALIILILTYILTTFLPINYPISAGISIETSIIWAFIFNDKWTFRNTWKGQRWYNRLFRYNLISLAGLTINETILLLLTQLFGIYYLASEALAIIFTFAFNYLANLKWTWRRATNWEQRDSSHIM
jgi:dolichol-phosphate mannosyltransferase